MNMSEKVGRLGRELYRVDVLSHGSENLYESNVLLDSFCNDPNGAWRHHSRDRNVLNILVRF